MEVHNSSSEKVASERDVKAHALHEEGELSSHATPPNEVATEGHGAEQMTWHTYLGIISLLVTYNGYLFTQQMPPTVLAYINADLGPKSNYIWITVAWNLVAAVVVTVSGRFADIFGRRWFLIVGAAISTVGAIVGATGHSIEQMIASGVLFGLGGGMQEMIFSCIQELVPNNKRFLMLGITELGNLPAMFSPLISYAWIAYLGTGWRTCYYWCIAFEALAVGMLFVFYHPPSFETKHQADGKSKWQIVKEMDHVGLVAFSAACTILLVAINWGGVLYPWNSAQVIAPIVVSGALFIFLGFWEVYAPLQHPILPPRLFRKFRDFTAILVVVFVAGMLYYSNLSLWPRISSLLFIPANDTIMRGLYANLTSFSTMMAALYGLSIMPWVGHERWQVVTLATLQTVFLGSLSSLDLDSKARTIAFVLLAGTCSTSTSILTFGTISLGLDDQADIGVAIGLVSTSRLIGGAIAGAIYTSIYTNRYASEIPSVLQDYANGAGFAGNFTQLLTASATNTAASYSTVQGITPAVIAAAGTAVKVAYIRAFRVVFWVAIAFGVVAITAALMTRSVPLSKKTKTRAVTMENEKGVRGDAEKSAA